MEGIKEIELTQFFNNAKKCFFYALKISPIYILSSIVIVWGYLGHFSRLDLLIGAIESKTTLISIFGSFLFMSVLMSFIFVLPSVNLILFSSFVKESYISSTKYMPYITLMMIISMLISIFILSSDLFASFAKENIYLETALFYISEPFRSLLISFIPPILFMVFTCKVKNTHANIREGFSKLIRVACSIVVTSFICFLSSISITLSISLLLMNMDGHTFSGFLYALFFLSFYSILSLFPAMIFYSRNFSFGNNDLFNIKVAKETIFSVLASLFLIFFFWPNGFLFISSNTLSVIGILDKRTHYYHVTSDKYYKELFPNSIWDTQSLKDRSDFFIKAVNMFSLDGKNLICPEYVENLRRKTLISSFDHFPPKQDKNLTENFKSMAKGCVVLSSDEFKQWDTIINAEGKFKI
ncbi:hypothetical protein R0L47_21160 [Pectobacterium polonicum]|uniref:hypothetical protein n=1 Tax=Pectobacterium TaxID=122277 RepID=UPI0010F7EA93|nr:MULTISPECIES: hypothetical protein [Pectobacterium]MCY9848409.1 hypothetical protein [Pectobacterium jejuense]TKY82764.1 hypothetical protein EDI29_09605 [Pectobacterium polonicum]